MLNREQMVERIAANAEQVLDTLVQEYVDVRPRHNMLDVPGSPRDVRAMHLLGEISVLVRCAAGAQVSSDDPTVRKVVHQLIQAERARRSVK